MKHRPILFTGEMVQAILDGRKTQTRRMVKLEHEPIYLNGRITANTELCPYGQPGDVLWVRETWRHKTHNFPMGWPYEYKATAGEDGNPTDGKWKPSLHMPKDACRLFLSIKSVRVERLQDISAEDAVSEGIMLSRQTKMNWMNYLDPCGPGALSCITSFRTLWQSINGIESWDANPWVWVIEFEQISREEAGI